MLWAVGAVSNRMVLGAALVVGRTHQMQRCSCVGSLAHAIVAAPTTDHQAMLKRAVQTMQYMLLCMQRHAVLHCALLPLVAMQFSAPRCLMRHLCCTCAVGALNTVCSIHQT